MAYETYTATYEIDGGASKGFGATPDCITETAHILVGTSVDAFHSAMMRARQLAQDHLANPNTGRTTVALSSLLGPGGIVIPFDKSKAVATRHSLASLFGSATPPTATS